MLSNGIVALASGLYAQYQGFADVQAGRGAIVIGLAAVIIGQVVFGKICKNFATRLLAVALGAVIYYLVLQVVLWLGLNANDLKLMSAIVVGVFLSVPYIKGRYFTKTRGNAAKLMLDIRDVYKTFNNGTVNEKNALRGVSLTLEDGDFVTVIGGNGAGKSTMLNMVGGV